MSKSIPPKALANAIALIQAAELDVHKFIQDPVVYDVVEYFDGVHEALAAALSYLNADPIDDVPTPN